MKMTIMVAALCGGMVLSGCSTVPGDPAKEKASSPKKKIKVTVEPDRSVQITNTTVSQYDDELKVTGILRPKSVIVRTVGHIHVSFLEMDGTTIRSLKVEPTGKRFFRRSISPPRFGVSISLPATEVSEVYLKHHDVPLEVCSYQVGVEPMGEAAR